MTGLHNWLRERCATVMDETVVGRSSSRAMERLITNRGYSWDRKGGIPHSITATEVNDQKYHISE